MNLGYHEAGQNVRRHRVRVLDDKVRAEARTFVELSTSILIAPNERQAKEAFQRLAGALRELDETIGARLRELF